MDVAALIPRYSWEIMDEQQKDDLMAKVVLPRYMETTSDGVQLGPKAWAKLLGTTASAITNRVYRLNQAESPIALAHWTEGAREQRNARAVLREVPEIVAHLTPAEQRKLATVLDTESAKRQKEHERVAKQKEREHLGDEVVDGLEAREELQSTEYLLIKARGNLRGFVKHVGEIGADNTPEAWRASCLDWIDDLEGHLGMARAVLTGDDIDWSAFDELLAKEGS
jgi:hypothetical protein